ncbi:MAG: D-alanyl-D-alanine carboxypeptidase family protein [Steroidobacteraceae bacterium]
MHATHSPRTWRCAFGALIGGLLLSGAARAWVRPVDLFPRAAAAYLVAVNGEALWARAPKVPHPVGSLTKLLAALCLLESGWDADAVVPVSPRAAGTNGTRLGLRAGEQARAGDLLTAMLVASSNDACLALAEHATGDAIVFVARMNARAARLGMRDSHFEHPCGLDHVGQFSTAADLLQLAKAVYAEPWLMRVVSQRYGELRTLQGRRLTYHSSNLLLGRLEGAVGLKTGTTSQAGHCLIATARRGSHTLTVVLLDAADRWSTASVLIEEGFRASAGP